MIYDSFLAAPLDVVHRILDITELKPEHKFCDVGSGDGIFVIEAAKRCVEATGIEIDTNLCDTSRHKIQEAGLTNAKIIYGDAYYADYSQYDIITCNWSEEASKDLIECVKKTSKPGAKLFLYQGALGDVGRRCHQCLTPLWEQEIENGSVVYSNTDIIVVVQFPR
jgi:cyclopropane fatty-acyl-phospholipid synthase-like methyltransferase